MKIFGREPAAVIGFIGALVAVVVALEVPWLDAGAGAALVALATAAITAWATRPVAPATWVGVLTAGFALAAEYGLNWTDEGIAAASALLIATLALNTVRPQVTPVADPRTIDGQVVTR